MRCCTAAKVVTLLGSRRAGTNRKRPCQSALPQGATWRTAIRNYEVHDPAPPPLTAAVGPGDVPGLPAAEEYAVYCDSTQVRGAVLR